MNGVINHSSMVSVDLNPQPAECAQQESGIKQSGSFSQIRANFQACFTAAGDSLKSLYYSAKQQISNSIPKSLSGLSLSSTLSSASSSLKFLAKRVSFKMPWFMSSRGSDKVDCVNLSTENNKSEGGGSISFGGSHPPDDTESSSGISRSSELSRFSTEGENVLEISSTSSAVL